MDKITPTNNFVNDFTMWALKLGCPSSHLLKDSALCRIEKMPHLAPSLANLSNVVRPRSEVQTTRNNILLDSVSKLNSSILSKKQLKSLPQSFQNLKLIENLEGEIKEVTSRVEEYKTVAISKQSSICEKGIQVMKLKKALHDNQSTNVQLEQKSSHLMEKVKQEKEFEVELKKCTPIDATNCKVDMHDASNAISKSLCLLEHVYKAIGDRPLTKNSKEKLGQELTKITAGIPTFYLLEAIKSHKNNQMTPINNMEPVAIKNTEISDFNMAIFEKKTKITQIHFEVIALKVEEQAHIEQFVNGYKEFLEDVLRQMRMFNSNDSESDSDFICSEYVKEFIALNGHKGQLDFYEKAINYWQNLVLHRNDQLKCNVSVASELNVLYDETEKTYNDIMDDIAELGVVTKKLKYLQEYSIYSINCGGNRSIRNNSVFNSTISRLNPSLRYQPDTTNSTPTYLRELSMLLDIPIAKWNSLPINISMEIDGHLLDIIISPLFPFLTPSAALKEWLSKHVWYEIIDDLSKAITTNIVVPEFKNIDVAFAKSNSESAKMSDLMEQIKRKSIRKDKTMVEMQKYLDFLLNSSLSSFIPKNVIINGRNFQEYEQEFLCACTIISNHLKKNTI